MEPLEIKHPSPEKTSDPLSSSPKSSDASFPAPKIDSLATEVPLSVDILTPQTENPKIEDSKLENSDSLHPELTTPADSVHEVEKKVEITHHEESKDEKEKLTLAQDDSSRVSGEDDVKAKEFESVLQVHEETKKNEPTETVVEEVKVTGAAELLHEEVKVQETIHEEGKLDDSVHIEHEAVELKKSDPVVEVAIKNESEVKLEEKPEVVQENLLEKNTEESKSAFIAEMSNELLQSSEPVPQEPNKDLSDEAILPDVIQNIADLEIQEHDESIEAPPPPVLFREPSSSDPEAPDSQHTYFQELGAYRVQMSDWDSFILSTYIYDDSPLSPEGLNRINREIKALTRSLPCEPSGAVFMHIDSSNLSRIKAIISGTEDTPYEHGLYLFDIKLDSNYPNTPPKMTIKTTGDGTLRFNPNLYDSGFVCLSIINTWGGDPEEMWNPSYSTLMQVFLSIQALVMNNDVIQKEPGYEGYPTLGPENRDYMAIVKYGNIAYAMIEMMKNPPAEFKEIVYKHFSIKKEKILVTVEKWLGELAGIGAGFGDCIVNSHNPTTISVLSEKPPIQVFQELFEELKIELDKLPTLS